MKTTDGVLQPGPRRRPRKGGLSPRSAFLALFTLPTFGLFALFVLFPIVRGLYYSFFQWTGLSSNMTFLGFDNYRRLVSDSIVWTALKNDLVIAVIRLAATLLLSLGLALILTRMKVFGNGFFRNVLFFPVMLSAVVICTVWMMMYNPSFGVVTDLLGAVGIKAPDAGWLGDYRTALFSTIPPAVWCSIGFYMIIFISAIESMPDSLFEAATIDGASGWMQARSIILPLLRPQINFCVVYVTISSMNGSYLFVKLLTNGGPNSSSEVLGTYMTLTGFSYHQFGYATAIATLILAATLAMSGLLGRIFRSEGYEY